MQSVYLPVAAVRALLVRLATVRLVDSAPEHQPKNGAPACLL
jgi:hypothetical protein